MSTILKSLHGNQVGIDKDGYLTSPVGIKVPSLFVGPNNTEVQLDNTVTAASTPVTVPRFGTATLGATGGANLTYHLQAPVAGCRKVIAASGTSTGQILSSTAAGAAFNSTAGATSVSCTIGKGGALLLEGLSTALWQVVSNYGGVFA